MLYTLIEANRAAMIPVHIAAKYTGAAINQAGNPLRYTPFSRSLGAAASVLERASGHYGKPAWNIAPISQDGQTHTVTPVVVWSSPWCKLVHFDTAGFPDGRPRILLFAPLSGHFATLLRGTVEAFLPTHDVYITDWTDAKMAPLWFGQFDLDDYIDHARWAMQQVGPEAHVVAVCQPGPPVLAAIAMMAEDADPALPASMTFMGSPIDARKSPTVPNLLAEQRSLDWFRDKMIHTVPAPWPGMMRPVYPGFVQLSSFMHMNWDAHTNAQARFFEHLVEGDEDSAEHHRMFYDEYLSVLDLTDAFYMQTIQRIFQEHHLAHGLFHYRNQRRVDLAAIENIGLMTVEGEKDDISGIGQTQAAHDLCVNIPAPLKTDYVQPGVGHYGLFNGRRFRRVIVPRMLAFQRHVMNARPA